MRTLEGQLLDMVTHFGLMNVLRALLRVCQRETTQLRLFEECAADVRDSRRLDTVIKTLSELVDELFASYTN